MREAQLAQAADIVRRYEPLKTPRPLRRCPWTRPGRTSAPRPPNSRAAQQSPRASSSCLGKSGTLLRPDRGRGSRCRAARLNVGYCPRRRPFDGRVASLNIAVGRYAGSGSTLFGLWTRKWYVIANYRETYLKSIRPGAVVEVFLMAYPGHRFRGVVEGSGWAVQTDASTSSGDPLGIAPRPGTGSVSPNDCPSGSCWTLRSPRDSPFLNGPDRGYHHPAESARDAGAR